MIEFLSRLFDETGFMPRWTCGEWTAGHGWLHIASDVAIFGAYAAIPAVIIWFARRRKDVPFTPLFWMFAVFILSCGLTHLVEATLFWHPWYRLSGLLKLITAGASWATVAALIRAMPMAVAIPGLATLNSRLQSEVAERTQAENRYRELYEQAPSYYATIDVQTAGITLCNTTFAAALSLPRDSLIGKPITDLCPPDSGLALKQALLQLQRGEAVHNLELQLVRQDRSILDVLWSATPARIDDGIAQVHSAMRDVSGRKRAETALRESEQRFQAVIEWAPTAMIVVDEGGTITLVNRRAEECFGYERQHVIGKPIDFLIPQRFREAHRQHLSRFFHAPKARSMGENLDLFGLRQDGSEFPVEVGLNPIRSAEGWTVVATVQDITERRLAENRLRESEQRFQSVIQSAPNAMILVDREGTLVLANQRAEEYFGYGRNELVGLKVEQLIPNRFRGGHQEHVTRFFSQPSTRRMGVDRDLYGQRKNGSEFPVAVGLNPIQTNHEPHVIASIEDITERRQAELALAESEEHLRRAVVHAPFPVLIHAENGEIIHASQAWGEQSGYVGNDLRNADDWATKAYPGRSVAARRAIQQLYQVDAPVDEGEHVIRCRDGEQRTWHFRTAPLGMLRDGRRIVITMAADVTELKRFAQQLERNATELKRSNEDLEQFAYAASHDLQEPLRAVSGYCQLLELEYGEQLTGESTQYLRHIVEGTHRMHTLINGLLAYSRVQRRGEEFEAVDCSSAVQEALKNLSAAIRESGTQISIADDLPIVRGDQAQMVQLFQNLLGNALKYRTSDQATVQVQAELRDREWLFSVADNAIGISPEFRERIFQIFQRLHTREEYPGTGIGLSLCKRIVERHGGRIWLDGDVGRGTTFYFTVPAVHSMGD